MKNKKFIGAISGVLAGVMLLSGVLAYQGGAFEINNFFGSKATPPEPDPERKPEITELFTPSAGVKQVSVTNKGDVAVYASLNLSEYLKTGDDAPRTKEDGEALAALEGWELHLPTDPASELDARITWAFNNDKIVFAEDFNEVTHADGVWIYDTNGYAYWSKPIQPGEQTPLFLTEADTRALDGVVDYYYAINVGLEYIDHADLMMWGSNDPDLKDTEDKARDTVAPATEEIRTYFAGLAAQPDPTENKDLKYNYVVTGFDFDKTYALGETFDVSSTVITITSKALDGAGDPKETFIAQNIKAVPEKAVEGTEFVTLTFDFPNGGKGTYTMEITVGEGEDEFEADFEIDGKGYVQVKNDDPTAHERIIKDENGVYHFYNGANMSTLLNGDASESDLLGVVFHPTPDVYIRDADIRPTTSYYHTHTATHFVPIYAHGVNYAQSFRPGINNVLGGEDEVLAILLTGRKVIEGVQIFE